MTDDAAVLEVDGIVKRFAGVAAVDGASFAVAPGEIHGLVGENGAGKSTLIKVISGLLVPDEGSVRIADATSPFGSVRHAQEAGVATLHQELALVGYLDVAENIFLGRPLPQRVPGLVDWRRLRREARAALTRLGVELPMSVPVAKLSPAMQTMVTIARALSQDARVLILDEPTASLTERESTQLFSVLCQLRDEGISVIYVSHRLEEIFELCDRVTVMRDGRVVTTDDVASLTVDELIRHMVGVQPDQFFPDRAAQSGPVVLKAENLNGPRIRDVSLVLRGGEVVGIAGLSGAGRTELLRLLGGAQRRESGSVTMVNGAVDIRSPRDALRAGVALVPEERRTQGLVMTESVQDNLVAAVLNQLSVNGVWRSRRRERAQAQQMVSSLRIKTAGIRQKVSQLSGGNQQKVVLGKFLARRPSVLLLDEPTRGIDVATKAEIYRLIRDLAEAGTAIALVSSELPELLGVADRLLVLHDGRVTAELSAAGADEHEVLAHCYGKVA